MYGFNLGFIGFGEAASGISKGLKESGLENIYFYDAFYNKEPMGQLIMKRANDVKVILCENEKELANKAQVIMSSVVAKVAVGVAQSISPYLTKNHIYIDTNSASPMVKEEVSNVILASGAKFVDAALMGPIPTYLNRVPIFACGNGANEFKELMSPYNMNITNIGDKPGQASAIKMFRSIFMKGYVTLLMETMIASNKYNASDLVLQSIAETMDKESFMETVRLLVTRGVIHAERRAYEMNEVLKTLSEIGVDSTMSEATKKKLQWCSDLNMRNYFNGEPPKTLDDVLKGFENKGI